jgi:hypothetical protein
MPMTIMTTSSSISVKPASGARCVVTTLPSTPGQGAWMGCSGDKRRRGGPAEAGPPPRLRVYQLQAALVGAPPVLFFRDQISVESSELCVASMQ